MASWTTAQRPMALLAWLLVCIACQGCSLPLEAAKWSRCNADTCLRCPTCHSRCCAVGRGSSPGRCGRWNDPSATEGGECRPQNGIPCETASRRRHRAPPTMESLGGRSQEDLCSGEAEIYQCPDQVGGRDGRGTAAARASSRQCPSGGEWVKTRADGGDHRHHGRGLCKADEQPCFGLVGGLARCSSAESAGCYLAATSELDAAEIDKDGTALYSSYLQDNSKNTGPSQTCPIAAIESLCNAAASWYLGYWLCSGSPWQCYSSQAFPLERRSRWAEPGLKGETERRGGSSPCSSSRLGIWESPHLSLDLGESPHPVS